MPKGRTSCDPVLAVLRAVEHSDRSVRFRCRCHSGDTNRNWMADGYEGSEWDLTISNRFPIWGESPQLGRNGGGGGGDCVEALRRRLIFSERMNNGLCAKTPLHFREAYFSPLGRKLHQAWPRIDTKWNSLETNLTNLISIRTISSKLETHVSNRCNSYVTLLDFFPEFHWTLCRWIWNSQHGL